jgi:hypothetical protein
MQATQSYGGVEVQMPLILKFGTNWSVSRSGRFTPRTAPTVSTDWVDPEPVWMFWNTENFHHSVAIQVQKNLHYNRGSPNK